MADNRKQKPAGKSKREPLRVIPDSDNAWDQRGAFTHEPGDPAQINEVLPEMLKFLADRGEHAFIVALGERCVSLLDRAIDSDEFRYQEKAALRWLKERLQDLGESSPDVAFRWKIPGKRGPRRSVASMLGDVDIVLKVKRGKVENRSASIEDLIGQMAIDLDMPEDTLWDRYKRGKKLLAK